MHSYGMLVIVTCVTMIWGVGRVFYQHLVPPGQIPIPSSLKPFASRLMPPVCGIGDESLTGCG